MMSVYALVDPRTNKVHYIGLSTDVQARYIQHLWLTGDNQKKKEWIREIKKEGMVPSLLILEENIPDSSGESSYAYQREDHWIRHYLAQGMPLTNKIAELRPKEVLQHCKHCGKDVPQLPGKRKKEYCNEVCKQLAYRRRKREALQPQVVNIQPVYDMTELAELRAKVKDQALTIDEQASELARLKHDLDTERRYLEDTTPRTFKSWLKKQPSSPWRDRFLSDQLVPARGTRAHYEAHMRRHHATDEELADFTRLWKLMLLERD